MVKFYSVALVLGVIGLIVLILGGTFAENVGREDRDPGRRIGRRGRTAIGGLVGFGMAGISAEFSTLDLDWPVTLGVALLGAAAGALWTWYSSRGSESDAGPV
jgi:hypothetical protein